jgi:hypothetical protein
MPGGNGTGITEAGFIGGRTQTFEYGYLMTVFEQLLSCGDADHASSHHQHVHLLTSCGRLFYLL